MKAASVNELKQELKSSTPAELLEMCMRLARFKKENKELMTYLLFEAHDPEAFIRSVKAEMDECFEDVNTSGVYLAKKTLRKILRIVNKHIRYSGLATVEIELLAHFCEQMKELGLPIDRNPVLQNMYMNQLKRIHKAIGTLHEDLQYDYSRLVSSL
jgi:hypothetical protein